MQSFITWANAAGGHPLLAAAIDAILKSSVLLILAAMGSLWLGRASAAVRHRLWCLTFAGLLLLPALSFALPAWRIPVLPPVEALELPTAEIAEPALSATPAVSPALVAGDSLDGAPAIRPMEPGAELLRQLSSEPVAADGAAAGDAQSTATIAAVEPAPASLGPQVLLWVWLAGTACVALPLLIGLAHSAWLGWRANRITDAAWTGLLDELRGQLQLRRRVSLLELRQPVIPMTWGVVRPVVIVPQSAQQWPERLRRFVLLHELAHVKRWDVPFQLLGRLGCAVYWFHPLAWYALRRLRIERELACDDCVVTTGERPSDYAEQLLQIVRTCRPAGFASVGVAMARTSHLEGRIRAMFDKARSHLPLTARAARTLSIAAALLVTTVAVVRPAAREAEPVDEAAAAADRESSQAVAVVESQPVDEDERSYSGRVVDAAGRPLAGATVRLATYSEEKMDEKYLQSVATADADGRFQFTLTPETRALVDASESVWSAVLIAEAPKHGLDSLHLDVFAEHPAAGPRHDEFRAHIENSIGKERFAERTLILRPSPRPIRGRLLDLEGFPLPDVVVRVESVTQPDIPLLLKALQEKSKNRYYEAVNASGSTGGVYQPHAGRLLPSATTDSDGRFEFSGIGEDQVVSLSINGTGVEAQLINVVGRSMEPSQIPHIDHYPNGAKDVFFGWDFTHAVGPSIPVIGVVKDVDTGEPVPDTAVRVERLFSEGGGAVEGQLRLDTAHMHTTTDAEGRFRLDGMPPGIGHILEARPPKELPYLMASHSVTLELDESAGKEIEILVKKTLWIEGRVTDRQTGAPVLAYVDYLALESNPHTLDKHGLQQAFLLHRYRTDSDGRYRIPGLPGPGIAMVLAIGDRGYPREVGAETVEGYDKDSRYIPTNPVGYPLSNWNLIRSINPAPEDTTFTCDFELDAGQAVAGRVVGPDGVAVTDFSANGEVVNDVFWKRHSDGGFAVQGYDGTGPRRVFIKSPDESLIGQVLLEGAAPEELVVTLEPAVRVTGRLIAQETSLPAERFSLYCDSSSVGPFRIADNCNTGDDGRFEIKGLAAGLTYEIDTANPQHFSSGKNDFSIDLTQAKPGDVVEIGDVPNRQPEDSAARPAAKMKPESGGEQPAAGSTISTSLRLDEEPASITVSGTVVDADGQPVPGAFVAVGATDP
ncbi:MAG: hypothetical protein JNG89_13660, partial [Planctomycetaceae bacterium]|nr:hypothetical protein [Planctomycetaceae bacterium]